jgi:hypothetical protein
VVVDVIVFCNHIEQSKAARRATEHLFSGLTTTKKTKLFCSDLYVLKGYYI